MSSGTGRSVAVPDLGAVTKPIAITLYFLPGNALIRALLNRNFPSLFISDVHKKGSNNVRRFFMWTAL